MKSKIITLEKLKLDLNDINSSHYYPCFIDGKFALFTNSQLNIAISRGVKKQNLIPKQNWLFKLFSKYTS